jgi:hypothetical protein
MLRLRTHEAMHKPSWSDLRLRSSIYENVHGNSFLLFTICFADAAKFIGDERSSTRMPFITDTKQKILVKGLIPNTILFEDDHVIVANTEDELQSAAYTLNNKR